METFCPSIRQTTGTYLIDLEMFGKILQSIPYSLITRATRMPPLKTITTCRSSCQMGLRFKIQNSTLETLARAKCGSNMECLFDVSTTGQLTVGESTLTFTQDISNLKEELSSKIL